MKSNEYTQGCDIVSQLAQMGKIIDNMSIPMEEKTLLIESLKHPHNTINLWLIRGRSEAESDKGQKVGFKQFLHNIKKLIYDNSASD